MHESSSTANEEIGLGSIGHANDTVLALAVKDTTTTSIFSDNIHQYHHEQQTAFDSFMDDEDSYTAGSGYVGSGDIDQRTLEEGSGSGYGDYLETIYVKPKSGYFDVNSVSYGIRKGEKQSDEMESSLNDQIESTVHANSAKLPNLSLWDFQHNHDIENVDS